jgi:hypothetical protein
MVWLPLAEADPVPGDHFAVGELGASFNADAARIRAIITELQHLDAGLWEGEAAEAFTNRREHLIPHLDALATRWEGAGRALSAWAPALMDARDLATRALRDAQAAEEGRVRAQAGLEQAQAEEEAAQQVAPTAPGAALATRPPDFTAVPWWQHRVAEQEDALAAARTLLGQARELYETGAARCEAALHAAADDSLENHGGFLAGARRTIHGAVRRFPQIKTIAKYVGLAAGGLAVAAAMCTGVGALATAAFVAGGLATTLDTALAVSGDGKVSTAVWDGFGLLTFGLGRAFASAARGTAGAAALKSEAELATGSLKGIVAESLKGGRPLTGAAARSRLLKLYREWKAFAPEAAEGAFPEGRNWLRAATFWQQIEVPPKDLLLLSHDAEHYAHISRVLEGATRANDMRGTITSEYEILEGHPD